MVINAACKIFGHAKSKDDRERIIAFTIAREITVTQDRFADTVTGNSKSANY